VLSDQARALVDEVKAAFGSSLRSAVVYGSVARREEIEGLSNLNVLLLLDELDIPAMERAAPLARKWERQGNLPPLLMTWEEWRRSADSFAIEVADMQDAHDLLAGEDPVLDLTVQRTHLRLQAERELKEKLLLFRTRLMLVAHKPEEVGRLLLASLPSFTTYARALLRLTGGTAPRSTAEVIRSAAATLGADMSSFERVLAVRTGKKTLRAGINDEVVVGYYAVAKQMSRYVDSFGETISQ
jgi:hypothetical protein